MGRKSPSNVGIYVAYMDRMQKFVDINKYSIHGSYGRSYHIMKYYVIPYHIPRDFGISTIYRIIYHPSAYRT